MFIVVLKHWVWNFLVNGACCIRQESAFESIKVQNKLPMIYASISSKSETSNADHVVYVFQALRSPV